MAGRARYRRTKARWATGSPPCDPITLTSGRSAFQLVLPANAHCRLRLRLPSGERLARVLVGSAPVAANRAGTIDLGARHGAVLVRATVS